MIVHVLPLKRSARDLVAGGSCIVLVTPVSRSHEPNLGLIQGLFDLSPAESRVAAGISRGLNVREIAARSGVAPATVRNQIKAILAKTGTRRQSEIAGLLSGLPTLPYSASSAQTLA